MGESNREEEDETKVNDCRDWKHRFTEEQKKAIIRKLLLSSGEDGVEEVKPKI